MLEGHLAASDLERLGTRRIAHLGRLVDQLDELLGIDHRVLGLPEHEAQRIERHADLQHVRVDQHQVAHRHDAAQRLLPRQQHDRAHAGRDDGALTQVQRRERVLVVHAALDPGRAQAGVARELMALAAVHAHRLVVEQAVDQLPVGARVELVDAALHRHATARHVAGVAGIDDEGEQDDADEPRPIAHRHDDQHRADLHQRRQQREQQRAEQEADAGRAAVDVADQRARVPLHMEARPHAMQVRQGALGEVGHRAQRHAREAHVAQLGEYRAREAQQGIAQQEEHRQHDELAALGHDGGHAGRDGGGHGLGPAEAIDHGLEQQRHAHARHLGQHQQHQRGEWCASGAARPPATRPASSAGAATQPPRLPMRLAAWAAAVGSVHRARWSSWNLARGMQGRGRGKEFCAPLLMRSSAGRPCARFGTGCMYLRDRTPARLRQVLPWLPESASRFLREKRFSKVLLRHLVKGSGTSVASRGQEPVRPISVTQGFPP